MEKATGLLTFDAADYAPKAVSAVRSLFAKTRRKAYYTGPLIPRTEEDTSKDPRSVKIQKFLDDKLVSHGEKSVVYVSMAVFMPTDVCIDDIRCATDLLRIAVLAFRQRKALGGA